MKKFALSLCFVSGVCFAHGQSLWQVFQLAQQNSASNQANLESQYSQINSFQIIRNLDSYMFYKCS